MQQTQLNTICFWRPLLYLPKTNLTNSQDSFNERRAEWKGTKGQRMMVSKSSLCGVCLLCFFLQFLSVWVYLLAFTQWGGRASLADLTAATEELSVKLLCICRLHLPPTHPANWPFNSPDLGFCDFTLQLVTTGKTHTTPNYFPLPAIFHLFYSQTLGRLQLFGEAQLRPAPYYRAAWKVQEDSSDAIMIVHSWPAATGSPQSGVISDNQNEQ